MPQATAFVGLGIYVRKIAVISPNTTTGDLLCVFGYDAQRHRLAKPIHHSAKYACKPTPSAST